MGASCSKGTQDIHSSTKSNGKLPGFKIVLIGDPGVGKTAIFSRYTKHQFDYNYIPTKKPNIDNIVKKINLPNHSVVSVTLWDLPGTEDIDLRSTYYRDVHAAIVVVDLTDQSNTELGGTWKQDFLNLATNTRISKEGLGAMETENVQMVPIDPNSIPVLLLGNKYDLIEKQLAEENKDCETEEMRNKKDGKDIYDLEDVKDENEEEETGFGMQRGPWPNNTKPDCVQLLEETAIEHGFVGSVIVSAKDGDNSVHTAIQSLVRHLLEKYGNVKYKKKAKKKKKKKKEVVRDEDGFQNLAMVEIIEFDQIFARCNHPMKKVQNYQDSYNVALRKFKQTCADAAVITEAKSSLEDCIIGLKREIPRIRAEDDGEGFLMLVDNTPEGEKLTLLLQSALQSYHSEFCLICRAILRDSENLETRLQKLENKISEKSEQVWDIMASQKNEKEKDTNYIYKVIDTCDRNRARIAHTRQVLNETLTTVKNAHKKIEAALMW